MISFDDYRRRDGLGLAQWIRSGEVSAREVLEAALARIEAVNPTLNAVIASMAERAQVQLSRGIGDGLFAGVPILVKDLIASCEGVATRCGCKALRDEPVAMTRDSELIRRLRVAGVLLVGKTNTPEFGLMPVTEPLAFGPTRNPWHTDHTPGGSSGGSAAAVAAGMVPIATGGDGGGSIRIPAACCGLFGLKPSRGRVPSGPFFGQLWSGLATEHVLTRTVRDSAAMLDALQGMDTGAPYAAPSHPGHGGFLGVVSEPPRPLRIAFTTRPLLGDSIHADCVQAVERTASLLADLGHLVEEATPSIDRERFSRAFLTIVAAQTRADIELIGELLRRKMGREDFEPTTYVTGLLGAALRADELAMAERTMDLTAREIGEFFTGYDLLLTPTLSRPPVRIGELAPKRSEERLMGLMNLMNSPAMLRAANLSKLMGEMAGKMFDFVPFTPVFNGTGQPAMSVPLHWNAQGLPIGLHFVGRFGEEATLLRLAAQLEQARPWFDRVPTVN